MNIAEMHSWFDILQDKGDSPYFTIDEKTQFLNRAQTKFVNEHMNKYLFTSGAQPEKNAIPYSNMESIQMAEDVLGPLMTDLRTSNAWVYTTLGHDGAYTPTLNQNGQIDENQLNYYIQGMLNSRNSLYHNAATWKKVKIISILNMTWAASNDDVSFRYVRNNDILKIRRNSFKKPTTTDPTYFVDTVTANGRRWRIHPIKRPNIYGSTTALPLNSSIYDLWGGTTPYTFATIPAVNLTAVRLDIHVIREPLPMFYDPITFELYPSTANDNVSCELPNYTHDEIMAIALDDAGVASRDESLVKLNQASKANITPQ